MCQDKTIGNMLRNDEKLPRTVTEVWLEAQAHGELWLFGRREGSGKIIEEEGMKYVWNVGELHKQWNPWQCAGSTDVEL